MRLLLILAQVALLASLALGCPHCHHHHRHRHHKRHAEEQAAPEVAETAPVNAETAPTTQEEAAPQAEEQETPTVGGEQEAPANEEVAAQVPAENEETATETENPNETEVAPEGETEAAPVDGEETTTDAPAGEPEEEGEPTEEPTEETETAEESTETAEATDEPEANPTAEGTETPAGTPEGAEPEAVAEPVNAAEAAVIEQAVEEANKEANGEAAKEAAIIQAPGEEPVVAAETVVTPEGETPAETLAEVGSLDQVEVPEPVATPEGTAVEEAAVAEAVEPVKEETVEPAAAAPEDPSAVSGNAALQKAAEELADQSASVTRARQRRFLEDWNMEKEANDDTIPDDGQGASGIGKDTADEPPQELAAAEPEITNQAAEIAPTGIKGDEPVAEKAAQAAADEPYRDDSGWTHYPWKDYEIFAKRFNRVKKCGCQIKWIKRVYNRPRCHYQAKTVLAYEKHYGYRRPARPCHHACPHAHRHA